MSFTPPNLLHDGHVHERPFGAVARGPAPSSSTRTSVPPHGPGVAHSHYIQHSLASQVGIPAFAGTGSFNPLVQTQNDLHSAHPLKRKRSSNDQVSRRPSEDGSSDGNYGSTSQGQTSNAKAGANPDLKKRTKTQRACDKCRTKKIRCDVLAEEEPPRCAHCKQYNYECTFFLPITETRFKKRKVDEDGQAQNRPRDGATSSPGPQDRDAGDLPKADIRIYGPTSVPFLLHSTATLPMRTLQKKDQDPAKLLWNVGKAGDSLIKVSENSLTTPSPTLPRAPESRIERDMIEGLLNVYFTTLAPMFPVVTRAEFLANRNPAPVLLYSICAVAATARNTPPGTLEAMRSAVSSVLRADDVLSTVSLPNIQALLILSMTADAQSASSHAAMSACWTRSGVAIRMAQDLGLHRAEVIKQDVETRRRVWACCVIMDRWYAAAYGHPLMIDVTDCDARLPTPDDQGIGYLNALTRLSMILGVVLKTIYSPTGLFTARDAELEEILAQLDQWRSNLPPELVFSGPESNPAAGLLHIFYSCVCMIFWRVFMRISYQCPAHLKFSLNVTAWSHLVKVSREAIEWLDEHEDFWDTWFLISYSLVSCALIQYHTWSRRNDMDAVETLRLLRDCVKRWEQAQVIAELSARRKFAEILALLYEATQGPKLQNGPQAISTMEPTAGSRPRIDSYQELHFHKDASRPGGGIFVTNDPKVSLELADVGENVILDTSPITSQRQDTIHSQTQTPIDRHQTESAPSTAADSSLHSNTGYGSSQVPVAAPPPLDGTASSSAAFIPNDFGLFEGVPGNMFDWNRWEEWLSSINGYDPLANGAAAIINRPPQ